MWGARHSTVTLSVMWGWVFTVQLDWASCRCGCHSTVTLSIMWGWVSQYDNTEHCVVVTVQLHWASCGVRVTVQLHWASSGVHVTVQLHWASCGGVHHSTVTLSVMWGCVSQLGNSSSCGLCTLLTDAWTWCALSYITSCGRGACNLGGCRSISVANEGLKVGVHLLPATAHSEAECRAVHLIVFEQVAELLRQISAAMHLLARLMGQLPRVEVGQRRDEHVQLWEHLQYPAVGTNNLMVVINQKEKKGFPTLDGAL